MQFTLLVAPDFALAASARRCNNSVKLSPPKAPKPSCKKLRRPMPLQLGRGFMALVVKNEFCGVDQRPDKILYRLGFRSPLAA